MLLQLSTSSAQITAILRFNGCTDRERIRMLLGDSPVLAQHSFVNCTMICREVSSGNLCISQKLTRRLGLVLLRFRAYQPPAGSLAFGLPYRRWSEAQPNPAAVRGRLCVGAGCCRAEGAGGVWRRHQPLDHFRDCRAQGTRAADPARGSPNRVAFQQDGHAVCCLMGIALQRLG